MQRAAGPDRYARGMPPAPLRRALPGGADAAAQGEPIRPPARLPRAAPVYPPNATIQLYGGPNAQSGLLLVYIESLFSWGTVCDDNFDSLAAAVACRQLGLGPPQTFYNPLSNPSAVWAPPDTPILLDNFACTGTEPALQACPLLAGDVGQHNCGHNEDVNLVCTARTRSTGRTCRPDPYLTFTGVVLILRAGGRRLQARRRSRRPRPRLLRPRPRRRRPLRPPHVRRAARC